MVYSLMVIAVIGAVIYMIRQWQGLQQDKRKAFGKKATLWGIVVIVLGLVVTGRAHWLMGVLAGLLALAGRLAQLIHYVPLFKQIFGASKPGPGHTHPTTAQMTMSREEAADILGVEVNASKEEVRMAHKRLMQKIHPDQGGTDALAKQINVAKKVMLS